LTDLIGRKSTADKEEKEEDTSMTSYVSWWLRKEAIISSPMTNVIIGIYGAGTARIIQLFRIRYTILCCDVTDSCICISPGESNEYEPHTGNFLSDMMNELESYDCGNYIKTFVSGGQNFTRMSDAGKTCARYF